MKVEEIKKIVYMDYVCPICKAKVWSYSDPSDDHTLGEYCANPDCNWFSNQFLSYEDMVEIQQQSIQQAEIGEEFMEF